MLVGRPIRSLALFAAAAAASVAAYAPAEAGATPGLRVSADKRSFIDGRGRPFFWMADTAWSMLFSLTPGDVDEYLAVRKTQGFNTVLIQLLADPGTPDRTMHLIFQRDAAKKPILSQPDPVFFANARAKISQINAAGMTAVIVLAWGSNVGTLFNADTARAYGKFVAQSFGDQNVVWMLGGDVNPTPEQITIWQAMADGVRSGERVRRLMSYHPMSGSSSQWFATDSRFDFNTIQSGHSRFRPSTKRIYGVVRNDYNFASIKPTADLESGYEYIPDALAPGESKTAVIPDDKRLDAYDMRVRAYQQLLAGGFGYTYGQLDVIRFYSEGGQPRWPKNNAWKASLAFPGAGQMAIYQAVRRLMGTPALVPHDGLVVEQTKIQLDYSRTLSACTKDNGKCLIYTTSGTPIVMKTGVVAATRYTWIDPRTGVRISAKPISSAANMTTFTPPPGPVTPFEVTAQGQRSLNDWLLFIR